jgi:hypothetical protein
MRIDTGQYCQNCCYFNMDEGDTQGYCSEQPYTKIVKPYDEACYHYVSDQDDFDVNDLLSRKKEYYVLKLDEDDESDYL